MVADHPDDEIGFVIRQAEALAGAARGDHAGFLLVALPLAGIVQQHREIQRAAVLDLAEQFVRERGDVAASVFEVGDGLDGAQRVLIDRVMMIHVELGLRDDRAEFGDRAAEHAGLVHPAQRRAGLLAAEDRVEDQLARFRHLAHRFGEAAQVARQRGQRGGVDVLLLAAGEGEQADHVERIARHDSVVGDADAAGVDHEARLRQRLRRAGGQETAQAFGLLLVIGFQLRGEDARQAADILGDEEVALHEAFDALLALAVAVAHAGGDLGLQVETEAVLGAAGDEVDMAAHGPEETRGADEDGVLMIRERTGLHHLFEGAAAIHVLADPVERLQVAQAALAFLEVRLDDIAGISGAGMAGIALGQLVGDELGVLAFDRLALEQGHHVGGEGLVAADEAGVQHAGLDRHVILGELDAFHRCTEGVADFQAHVPEGIEHVFDHALRMRTGLVGAQEEKVGIGGRRHHAAAVAAGGDDREALGLGRVGGAVDVGDGEIIERVDHLVLHGGEEAGGVQPVGPLLQAFLRNQAAAEHGAVQ